MPDQTATKPPTGHTKLRHFRIPPSIFDAAAERAAREGVSLSEIVRAKLRDYGEGR